MGPLVSVLIPTYNRPLYLQHALESAIAQTYENLEIIVGDNGNDEGIEELVNRYRTSGRDIHYYRNSYNIGFLANMHRLFERSTGDFINYLMDDDCFRADKIQTMMDYFLRTPGISLVTSCRSLMDEHSIVRSGPCVVQNTAIVDGRELGNLILAHVTNFIGEPTTVLFKKDDLGASFGSYRGKQYSFMVDVASWLTLLEKGNAVFLSEPLSTFRDHDGQAQKREQLQLTALEEWYSLIQDSKRAGYLSVDNQYPLALSNYMTTVSQSLRSLILNNRRDLIEQTALQRILHECIDHALGYGY